MDNIVKELGICEKNVKKSSKNDTFTAVVQYSWLKLLIKCRKLDFTQSTVYEGAWDSGETLDPLWTKIIIRVFPKRADKVLPLPRSKIVNGKPETPLCLSQLFSYVSQTNHRNLWKESYKKYSIPHNSHSTKEQPTVNVVEYSNILNEVILRLYGCNIVKIKVDPSNPEVQSSEITFAKNSSKVYDTHSNILPVLCAVDLEKCLYLIHYSHYNYNLLDCIIFSPALLELSYARSLFIIYQLLQAMKSLYSRGLNFGEIKLDDIYMNENLWIQISSNITSNINIVSSENISEQSKSKASTSSTDHFTLNSKNKLSQNAKTRWTLSRESLINLEKICDLWVKGCMSNLDYLVHLNVLAGRRSGDPTAHHVLPWVTDFSSRCGKQWRDLTKSKYRLTKGDRQLDMTYDSIGKEYQGAHVSPHQIPHHVSDILSDITYYVYTARRTPKGILCRNVRYNWVPAEYPSSIQRMQEWTPDECIPEFFTDPNVFRSIHEDLADLEVPAWATCVEDFVMRHREALESVQVSEALHHWIDLTFGYKLAGNAAVKAKNVCLSLVDGHTELTRSGPVQLFSTPHPARLSHLAHSWGEKLPPRIYWQRDRSKATARANESSDNCSEDDKDDSNIPQNYSSLSTSSAQRNSSRRKSSISRNRMSSKKSEEITTDQAAVSPPLLSSSSTVEPKIASPSVTIAAHHFKVQKSEWGKGHIYLPKEYNPISQLAAVENLHNFKLKTFYKSEDDIPLDAKQNIDTNKRLDGREMPLQDDSNFSNVYADMLGDEHSFTNQMFVASYEQSCKRPGKSEGKDRSVTSKFVTNISLFKQLVLANRKKDMQVLGCLIVEIFLHHKIRPFQARASQNFDERYKVCRLVLKNNISSVPKCVRYVATLLLQIGDGADTCKNTKDNLECNRSEVNFPSISNNGLPPPSAVQLSQPLLANHLFPFPGHFSLLYSMSASLHEFAITERELEILYSFECDGSDCSKYQCFDKAKVYFTQKIAESKVHSCSLQMEKFFNQIGSYNQFDSVDLFLPHFSELLNNKDTSILAAWYLFDPVSKALGPFDASKKLLNHILNLYDDHAIEKNDIRSSHKVEPTHNVTTHSNKKSVKLYHNIFLLQLIVRFGLQCFLENFVPHLVEAVGGYKDISSDNSIHSHSSNVEIKSTNSKKKLTYCEDTLKASLSAPHDALSPDTSCGSESTLTPCVEAECSFSADKIKKSRDSAENDLFHFESEISKDLQLMRTCVHGPESAISWEPSIFNKTNIKCLMEEIDLGTSPNSSDTFQAVEATESIYGTDENVSNKSDDLSKNPDDIYYPSENQGTSNSSPTGVDNVDTVDSPKSSKAIPTSPTIAIPTFGKSFTSFIQTEDNQQILTEMSQNELKMASKSLESGKYTEHFQKPVVRPPREKRLAQRANQLYLACSKDYKISEMSTESLIWLAHRLGPVLTCKHLTRNLLKMLTLCYIGQENVMPVAESSHLQGLDSLFIANGRLVGDCNATKVIECLTSIAALYGEQIILLQYFPHMGDLIASCRRRISGPLEGGLIACMQLLRYLIPYMSDVKLMEQLQDIILKNILHPTVRLISSTRSTFPNGHLARSALARKFLETLYVIALRIGPEMTRKHLCVPAMQRFFLAFDKVHGNTTEEPKTTEEAVGGQRESTPQPAENPSPPLDEGGCYLEICRDGSTAEWRVLGGQVCPGEGEGEGDSSSSPPDKDKGDTMAMSALEELQSVFNTELAHQSYVSFYKFIGEETMDRCLKNHLTLRELCQLYDKTKGSSTHCHLDHVPVMNTDFSNDDVFNKKALIDSNPVRIGMDVHLGRSDSVPCKTNITINNEETSNSNSFGSNVAIVGNRIEVQCDPSENDASKSGFSYIDALDIVSCKMENGLRSSRHLRGDWLMYWEHEIGRPDKDTRFNLKQIKLQTFTGHTHSVRNIVCLDNENSFMTGSKDKSVKLWSLRNQGDGSATSSCQWTYAGHRKGILSLTFLESLRLAVSTDASVHIWDPYVESIVAQLDNTKSAPVSIVKAMPAPSALVLAATTDTVLKLIDTKTCSYIHELKVTFNPNTFIRCICVSPSGRWVALGLATGHLSLLDPRTGALLYHWKAHDGEILQLVTVNESTIVSSSLDQTMLVWSTLDGSLMFQMKGSTEPVHCLSTYYTELISGTTNNRIGVHTAVDQDASFSSTKLRSDTFKGVLTSMAVLPLNRMLLLGGEGGNVSLLC